jgi:NADH-quinone oxidoreductase subunit K
MTAEIALLNNYLIVGAVLFGLGLIGFISRRNMIVMFLAAEMMIQGVSLSLVAWSRFHNNFDGQILVIFIIAVAACEAAIVLALVITLYHSRRQLDVAGWQTLREANQAAFHDEPLPPELEVPESWPHLAPAGIAPEVPPEKTDYRPNV